MSLTAAPLSFQSECKRWRLFRKLSQLDLALEANISQRHLSYLETGRSQPSREMVMQLSEALDVPLRERNMLLQSAGYASVYKETQLDTPDMLPVMSALKQCPGTS
jgi:transcriptional regulator with XRE-family HTH domain